jgi:uncharacterized protein with ParB-like and HNH nuclease domain
MKALQTTLNKFIIESRFFRIPDFQRPYAWRRMQGEAFWDSFHNTVSNSKRHYFGSVVFFEENENRVIIDGQQRLTTTLLFIIACYHALLDDSRKSWNYTAESLGKAYLYSEDNGELKVILRGATTDRETFNRILRRKELPIDEQSKLYEMYQYFVNRVKSIDKIDAYIDVLDRIDMISISLQPEDDNPQIIFENINATGEPLTDGDKIRNYALMLNSEENRNVVYNKYWLKIEKSLTRSGIYVGVGEQLISIFFRIFLTIKFNDKVINGDNTYEKFKEYYRNTTPDQSLEQLHKVWREISSILEDYTYLLFGEDITNTKTLSVFDGDIVDNHEKFASKCIFAHLTFFIQLLEYYKQGEITRNDFRNVLKTVRKQQVRDEIGRNGNLKLINNSANAAYKIYKDLEMKSFFDAYLWYMDGAGDISNSRNVTDEEILLAISNNDMSDRQAKFILLEIDGAHNEKGVSVNKNVDHIMPKAIYGFRLDDAWKQELGDEWEIINQRFYSKLANMALVDYPISPNKELSFFDKMSKNGGLENTNSRTTKWIADNIVMWNLDTLERRTKWLAEEINIIYKIPEAFKSDKIRGRYERN